MSTTDNYDAIIVGARIAGAATAALLAQEGARVLLLERAHFPAPTVSCPIFFGNSLRVLERMGVLADVEALGAPQITQYGSRTPDFDLVTHLPPSNGRDYAYSIRRDVLDTTIVRRVEQQPGVTLLEGFDVRELIVSMGRVVGVRGRHNGGTEQAFYARAVIGADGKRSFVARKVGAAVYDHIAGNTCIFYAYYRNFTPLQEPSAVIYGDPQSMKGVLVFDADDGLTVVSVGVPGDQFDAARKDPEGTIERVWRSIPELAERGRNAVRATPVMGQGPVDSFYRQSYGPGWALVGDAGNYVDPITGQGINHALHSAELFVEAWVKTQHRASWFNAMAEYQRRRDAATRPMWDLVAFGAQMQHMQQQFDGPLQDVGIAFSNVLFRAIARQPEEAAQCIGMFNGATPVRAFLNPLHLTRVLVRDGLRNELPQRALAALAVGSRRLAVGG